MAAPLLLTHNGTSRQLVFPGTAALFAADCAAAWGIAEESIIGLSLQAQAPEQQVASTVFPLNFGAVLSAVHYEHAVSLLTSASLPGDVPALVFDLFPSVGVALQFHWRDLVAMQFVHQHGQLSEISMASVFNTVIRAADSKQRLHESAFASSVKTLIQGKRWPRLVRLQLSKFFMDAFRKLCRTGDEGTPLSVHQFDAVCLFAIFCAGKKSDKLASLWSFLGDPHQLCDPNTAILLSRRQVWRFFRSLLLVLTVVAPIEMDPGTLSGALDDTAVEAAQAVFASVGSPATASKSPKMSFDAFGGLYNTASSMLLWLELFDHSKWPLPSYSAPTPCRAACAHSADTQDSDQDGRVGAAALLRIALPSVDTDDSTEGAMAFVSIYNSDVDAFVTFLNLTKLNELTPASLCSLATSAFSDGTHVLMASELDLVVASLIDTSNLSDAEVEYVLRITYWLALLVGYDLFDPASTVASPWKAQVKVDDFILALLFFSQGSKTDKLTAAFRMLSAEQSGGVSRRELWRLARAFLTALFIFSDDHWQPSVVDSMTAKQVRKLVDCIDAAAVDVAASVFVGTTRANEESVTFDELALLYNSELEHSSEAGATFESLAWFELVNTAKWLDLHRVTPSVVEITLNGRTLGVAVEDDEESRLASSSNKPVFVFEVMDAKVAFDFSLTSSSLGSPEQNLRLSRRAADFVFFLGHVTGFDQLTPSEFTAKLLEELPFPNATLRHRLSKAQFISLVPRLVPADALPQEARLPLSAFFLRLFDALDFDSVGTISVVDLIQALVVYAGGTKSDKLALAFEAYGRVIAEGQYEMLRQDLYRFFRCLFISLFVVQEHGAELDVLSVSSLSPSDVHVRLRTAVQRTASAEIAADDNAKRFFTHSRAVNFESLSNFYNSGGGYMVAPYLELLSMHKWGKSPSKSVKRCNAILALLQPTAPHRPIFEFVLQPHAAGLRISQPMCAAVQQLAKLSGLIYATPSALFELVAAASADGIVQRSHFESFVDQLVGRMHNTAEQVEWARSSLSLIYDTLDLDLSGYVLQAELTVSLLVFSAGHKSDKLAAVWEIFGDSNDKLSPAVLSLLLRGILLSLFAMSVVFEDSETRSEMEDTATFASFRNRMQPAIGLIDHTVRCLVAVISPAGNPVPYTAFADWYNEASAATEPTIPAILWLELLDLAKWPAASADGVLDRPLSEPDAVYRFDINAAADSACPVEITSRDLERMGALVTASRSNCLDVADIFATVVENTDEDDFIHERGWRACCMKLFPAITSDDEVTRTFVADELMNLFCAFDANGDGCVAPDLLSVGLCILASGSKSQKLAFAWQLLGSEASDGRVLLTKDTLQDLLEAVLRVVVHFSRQAGRVSHATIQLAASHAAGTIFSVLNKECIGFDDFSLWYNGENSGSGGYAVVPYIELMDLRKWFIERAVAVPAEDAVFGLLLTYEGDVMRVTTNDILAFQFFIDAAGLRHVAAKNLFEDLLSRADDNGLITNESLLDVLKDKMAASGVISPDSETVQMVRDVMAYMFETFDVTDSKLVPAVDIAAALSIMVPGSKSNKLLLGYTAYSTAVHGGQGLTAETTVRFLRALLLGMLTFAHADLESVGAHESSLWEVADRCARGIVSLVSTDSSQDAISFESLAQFYNASGYQLAGFLELLNPDRWSCDIADMRCDTDACASETVFQFIGASYANGGRMSIMAADASKVRRILMLTGLHMVDACCAYAQVAVHAVDGMLDKTSYNKVLRDLFVKQPSSDADRQQLSFALSSIFFALDSNHENSVASSDVAAALSILLRGSKADKIRLAWASYDLDNDGLISRGELVRLMRAFIGGLLALKCAEADDHGGQMHGVLKVADDDPRFTHVDTDTVSQLAMDMAEHIWLVAVEGGPTKHGLNLQDLMRVYNDAAQNSCLQWFELLDFRKWVSGIDRTAGAPPQPSCPAAVLEFTLAEDAVFKFSRSDASNILATSALSGLRTMTASELWLVLSKFSSGETATGVISEHAFRAAIRDICGGLHLTDADRRFLSMELMRVYFVMDELSAHDRPAGVHLLNLHVALLPLCAGSKSEKLSCVFEHFGSNNSLSDAQITEMLVSLLGSLFSLRTIGHIKSEDLGEKMAQAHVRTFCANVSSQLAASTSGQVTFPEFSVWYNRKGSIVCAFIELLSLSKLAAFSQIPPDQGNAPSGSTVLVFDLDDGLPVSIDEHDLAVAGLFHAAQIQPQQFSLIGGTTGISFAVSGSGSGGVESCSWFQQYFQRLLANLSSLGTSDLLPLAYTASLVICAGDKSSKLVLAWKLVTGVGPERLDSGDTDTNMAEATHQQVKIMLAGLLAGVCAFSSDFSSLVACERSESIHVCASRFAAALFAFESKQVHETVSFGSFGSWYNSDGFTHIPWIELINLDRWQNIVPTTLTQRAFALHLDAKAGLDILITGEDLIQVQRLRSYLGLRDVSSSRVYECFPRVQSISVQECAHALLVISSASYSNDESVLQRWVSAISVVLQAVGIYDVGKHTEIDSLLAFVLFIFFCDGSKSDKLFEAFRFMQCVGAMDHGNHDLHQLLYVCGQVVLAHTAAGRALHVGARAATLHDLADRFVQLTTSDRPSFQEFSELYNGIGHSVVPFLELFDLKVRVVVSALVQ